MFGIINYGPFIIAAVLLNLTPGIDTFYILGRSLSGGSRVGVASAFGVSSGLLLHTLLVAFGLSVVLMSSIWLFWGIKVVGACYLVYMGIRTFLSRTQQSLEQADDTPKKIWPVYLQGVITNVTNPKIALFFLAFLPQFVDPAMAVGPLPFLLLGLTFICTSTLWCLVLALGAGQFQRLLQRRPRAAVMANRITAILYIILGISIFATPMPE